MGDPRVVVAVVDTGIDARHPDLAGQLVPGYDIVHDTADPRDDNSHGTACAGIVAARAGNGIGLAGIAPGCRVMPVKVLDRLGNGPLELAARGFVWAVDHGASIISFSSGEDAPSQVLQDAIDYARAHDVVVLASMGNDGETVKQVPVKRGISDDSFVEIIEGVTEGAEVISGGFKAINRELEDGKKVKVDNEKKQPGDAEKK